MTATWTQPRTWSVGELTTAALMNTHMRDNFDALKSPPSSGKVSFAADFTSTSAAFVDVTGVTATITTFGGGLNVNFSCMLTNSSATFVQFQILVDGVVERILPGVTTAAAANFPYCVTHHIAAIAAGSHTIKIQTKCGAGTTTIKGTTAASGDPQYYVIEDGA
jgi:hypothetical protein